MFKVASLFAGIGGIDLAFEQSGFEVIWANEKDRYAAQTYRKNFPNVQLVEEDIRGIKAQDIPNIDILAAGFPCQPFSIMGYQRGFKDPRGNLFFEIARIIDTKRPKIVLLENVKNLLVHDNGNTFIVICNTLEQLGYVVKYKVMSPTEYANIPQDRKRIFIIAFFDNSLSNRFIFPEPNALTRTINDIVDRSEKHSDIYYYTTQNNYYELLNQRVIDKTAIYRIDDSGVAKRKYTICPTLKANMGTYHDRVPVLRDDFGIRKLTPMECLKFQGFPERFSFPKITLDEAYKQAGNTVCVPVIDRICNNLKM